MGEGTISGRQRTHRSQSVAHALVRTKSAFKALMFVDQKLSSSPLREPMARHVCRSIVSLMMLVWPSPKQTTTTPGCALRGAIIACSSGASDIELLLPQSVPDQLGGATWLYWVAS